MYDYWLGNYNQICLIFTVQIPTYSAYLYPISKQFLENHQFVLNFKIITYYDLLVIT